MKKIVSIIILTFLLLPQSFVVADGMLIPLTDTLGRLDLYETNQTALIVYNKGREDLYIKINYEGEANDFAWIIPTPSLPEPEEAVDDIFNELYEISKPETRYEGNRMPWGMFSLGYGDEGVEVHSQGVVGVYDKRYEPNEVFKKMGIPLRFAFHLIEDFKDEKEIIEFMVNSVKKDKDMLVCFNHGILKGAKSGGGHVCVLDRVYPGKKEVRLIDPSVNQPKWRVVKIKKLIKAMKAHTGKSGGFWELRK